MKRHAYILTARQIKALQNFEGMYHPGAAKDLLRNALWDGIGQEQGFKGSTVIPDPAHPRDHCHVLAEPITQN